MKRSEIVSAIVDAIAATDPRAVVHAAAIPAFADLVEQVARDLVPPGDADLVAELSHLVNTLAGVENERDVARAERDLARDECASLTRQVELAIGERGAHAERLAELTRERDDLARQVAELSAKGDAPKRRGRPPKADPVDQAPAEPVAQVEPAADPAPACFTPDRESIRAELVALGRDVGLPILARFGASRFAELPDADLPAVAAMIVAHKKGEAA